ncbi:MAG: hypothetical protein Q9159_003504 [Coniocarpon cinnabarinum]
MTSHDLKLDTETPRGEARRGSYPVDIEPKSYNKDEIELAQFGKKQRLQRQFGITPIIGLVCTLMVTWETIIMMPIAGGEYNCYLTGWITVVASQGAAASAVYLAAAIIQALAVLNYPSYAPTRWQLTLIMLAILTTCLFVNTVLARLLPSIESAVLMLHIFGFLGILIPLVKLGSKSPDSDVWQTFLNQEQWPTMGVSFMIGSAVSMLTFIGVDGASHLGGYSSLSCKTASNMVIQAEEIENASVVIPRAMIAATCINGATGFGLLVAVLYCADNINDAIESPTGQPFLEIFAQAVGSNGGATGMATVILVIILFCVIGWVGTSSRMLWAFARERGIPFHPYVGKVTGRYPLPYYAIFVTTGLNGCLALIVIGSTAAFNAFASITVSAAYASYMIAASCLLWQKLKGMPLRYGPFTLGRAAVPILLFSLAYSAVGAFFSFWPQAPNPDATTMNWAIVVVAGTVAGSLVYWLFWARKTYTGPVIEVSLDVNQQIHDIEVF